jgi:hypothetical protein
MSYPPMKLSDEFKFGKHKGSTVEMVIDEDPSYLRWALDGNIILLDNEAYESYEKAIDEYDLSKKFD